MLELLLCSMLTVLPDYLIRRYVQGKRLGREITLFTVWYELRYGITLCLVLTVSLITTIFYFHPSTMAGASVFRTVTILPEITGRVEETYVGLTQRVEKGDPLFRMDSSEYEADLETARKRIAEIDAELTVLQAKLAEADARIAQARGGLKQAQDEFEARADVQRRSPGSVAERDVERFQTQVTTQQAAVDAAVAARDTLSAQIEQQLPAQRETAVAALHEAEVALEKTLVVAGTDGIVQQFTLRPGDLVNALLRPAGILVPDRKVDGLLAGFGQIESQVIKEGMVGEVTCPALPWRIIPVVVTEVQAAHRHPDLPRDPRGRTTTTSTRPALRCADRRGQVLLPVAPAALRQVAVPGYPGGAVRRQRGAVRGAGGAWRWDWSRR
jgi:multidrug resistance efflux pump